MHLAHRRLLLCLSLALSLAACGEDAELRLTPTPLTIRYDAAEVFDVCRIDLERDGQSELLVSTSDGLHVLAWRDGAVVELTTGTGLDELASAHTLRADPRGAAVEREGGAALLVLSDIGTFSEQAVALPPGKPEARTSAHIDLDGDGTLEQVLVENRRVQIFSESVGGTLVDLSLQLGTTSLLLPGDATRLISTDLDGDGNLDLIVAGGRLFALFSSGGAIHAPGAADASASSREAALDTRAPSGASAPPSAWFSDATAASGLDFVHREGEEQWDIRPTMGPGVAISDVDADGSPDLFVPGGSEQSSLLALNNGAGHFRDATQSWGLDERRGAGMGACFADWDDDGDPDLYVTYDGPNAMWRHDGTRFSDISATSGTADPGWGASAAFADVDADGDLDLYVTNYLLFDLSLIPPEATRARLRREDPIAMLPYVFPGQANRLYRNDGGGSFRDVTESAGLLAPEGKSLGALFTDVDLDGDADLYVANDTTPNTLWRNDGAGRFEEVSLFVGLDDPRGGMGLAGADLDADGDQDLLLTNWQLEPNALYRNNHRHVPTTRKLIPHFEDLAVGAGLAQRSVGYVGWGCLLEDLDDDGDADVYIANGYTSPDYETTMQCVGQPDQLFENTSGPGPFTDHRSWPSFVLVEDERAAPIAQTSLASRGLAALDADLDGDLDLLVSANNGPLQLLRNESDGRALHVRLRGRPGAPNRDAIGARAELQLASGARRHAEQRAGNGYLGHSEPGLHFGLGDDDPLRIQVRWPDGTSSAHALGGPGRVVIEQPAP